MHRQHSLYASDAVSLATAQERPRRLFVGRSGIGVVNVDAEEFDEAPRGPLARCINERRKRRPGREGDDAQVIHCCFSFSV